MQIRFLTMYSYFIPCEFFTPALADGRSLESEWQQVSPGLQDFSECSSQSQQLLYILLASFSYYS